MNFAAERFGRLDCVVNNAGTGVYAGLTKTNPEGQISTFNNTRFYFSNFAEVVRTNSSFHKALSNNSVKKKNVDC
jgi:NAD(P)-dependent dehydrogenase (short-subunit alcohol dehydrogenase family)